MGAHLTPLRVRGSTGSHTKPVRPDFHLYWMVRQTSIGLPYGFPGHLHYPGLAPAGSVGLHSQTVQATVQNDFEQAMFTQRNISGGTGGVPSTTLAVSGNGARIDKDCRITGTGVPDGTFVVSYDSPGGNTGNIILSQAATVTNGTTLLIWRPAGHAQIIGGNGGVSGTTLNITANGDRIRLYCTISGYGIPLGTTVVSYTGGATGTLVLSQAVSVNDGVDMHLHYGAEDYRMLIDDWEGGGATPTSMKNCLAWLRSSRGYADTPFPKGYNSMPLGIYWGRECALGRPMMPFANMTQAAIATSRADNDTMTDAVKGTGNETCNYVCPEIYDNYGLAKMVFDTYWVASEWKRQSIPGPLVPFINPNNLPGGGTATLSGKPWRALLEAGFHNENISGFFIWHADRNVAWDESEAWFQQTLDFIATYGITTAPAY